VSGEYTELIGPLYGRVGGLPVIVVGTTVIDGKSEWVYIDDDGVVRTCQLQSLTVDLRFREDMWHDVSPTIVPPGESDIE